MKNLLLVLFLIVSLYSCNMQRYCEMRFPASEKDSINYREIVSYRDTLIPIYVQEITISDSVVVDSTTNSGFINIETDLCVSYAQLVNGKLINILKQKDSTINCLIKNGVKEVTVYDFVERKIRLPTIEMNRLTAWQSFQKIGFWVLASYIALTLLWKSLLQGWYGKILSSFRKKKPPNPAS